MIKKIYDLIKHPSFILYFLDKFRLITLSDEKFLKILYYKVFRKRLNLDNPKLFNEKLQWLKLYDRKKDYIKLVDKYEVKDYITQKIGLDYVIPTLGIYNTFEEINFDELPDQFVIKCTHNSGYVVVCSSKKDLLIDSICRKFNKLLRTNYYYCSREWPYINVKPRIIIEKYMKDENSDDLKDYKIFCFNGEPKLILVCSNRNGKHKNTDFFDKDWNLMPFTRENHTNNPNGIEKPKKLTEMLDIAIKLSEDIPFVRVDLYEINGQVYFGELTFFPSGGFEGFNPVEYDKILGDWLKLPETKVNKNEK